MSSQDANRSLNNENSDTDERLNQEENENYLLNEFLINKIKNDFSVPEIINIENFNLNKLNENEIKHFFDDIDAIDQLENKNQSIKYSNRIEEYDKFFFYKNDNDAVKENEEKNMEVSIWQRELEQRLVDTNDGQNLNYDFC
jgi:hypothetical protein